MADVADRKKVFENIEKGPEKKLKSVTPKVNDGMDRAKLLVNVQKGTEKKKLKSVTPKVHDGMGRAKLLGNVKKGAALNKVSAPETGLSRADKSAFLRSQAEKKGESFVEKLDKEGLKFFNHVCSLPFSEQAVAFLNAYWGEVGTQADFIYTVAWDKIKYADMHARGINYVHKYREGSNLEFDIGLYFYEQLCKFLSKPEGKEWKAEKYAPSQPKLMTAIVRKKELRDKVDVNFDGKVSMIEYLLYQYRAFANPADFVTRAMVGNRLIFFKYLGIQCSVSVPLPKCISRPKTSILRSGRHVWHSRRSTSESWLTRCISCLAN